jgi:hypothetical protein
MDVSVFRVLAPQPGTRVVSSARSPKRRLATLRACHVTSPCDPLIDLDEVVSPDNAVIGVAVAGS